MTALRENSRRVLLDLLQERVGLIKVELVRHRPYSGPREVSGVELVVKEVRLVGFKSSGKFENITVESTGTKGLALGLSQCSLHVRFVKRASHGTGNALAKSLGRLLSQLQRSLIAMMSSSRGSS